MEQTVARVEIIRDVHYGLTVEDPYRWMEDLQADEFQGWAKAQADYSRQYFDSLDLRHELYQRINELSAAGPVISNIKLTEGRYFYLRTDPGEKLGKLVVRAGINAPEKVLLNPNTLEGETHSAIDYFFPSNDGKLVAYGISLGGSENSTLHILDTETLTEIDTPITRARWGRVAWLSDNQAYFYVRFPEPDPTLPPAARRRNPRVYLQTPGRDPENNPAIFGRWINPAVEMSETDIPILATFSNSSWVLGLIIHGVMPELTLYAAPYQTIVDNEPASIPWMKICDIEDNIVGYAVKGDELFLRTHTEAPRYKIIAINLTNPDLKTAREVVPASPFVIQTHHILGDYLITNDLEDGIGKIRRVKLSGGTPEVVALPVEGTITECQTSETELLVEATSWTVSPRVLRYSLNENEVSDTGWLAPSTIDFSEIESKEVLAPGKDGTLIPLSIIHKKGLKLNGNNPTLMAGYGNYGLIVYPPKFDPTMLAWYERGGVFAAAHIRGGGEYGKEWYAAAYKLSKQNNIDDFIACGEYLIKEGFTSTAKLAGEGLSGGGIPAGGSLVQRPDLWSVIVLKVTVTDWFRFEFTENGPGNIPEFGSLQTEEGFRGLQIMDSYTKIQEGGNYPAVLLTAGMNDPRVVAWQPAKMAARLQAATGSGKPVLLRVEFEGGHGMGSTQEQLDAELADKLAFLLEQFGE